MAEQAVAETRRGAPDSAGDSSAIARPSFFFWMAATMTAVIFVGFGVTYLVPFGLGLLDPLPPMVHVHGFFYFSWMILLVAQSGLIRAGNPELHRSLGMLGIGIAGAMVVLGTQITLLVTDIQLKSGFERVYELNYISLVALVVFPWLFVLAIRNVRDGATHKRYVLLATVVLIGAGINRIWGVLFGIDFSFPYIFLLMYMTQNLWLAALLIYDWRTLGKPHKATLVGGAINVVPQILHIPLATSAAFVALTEWLASLARYS